MFSKYFFVHNILCRSLQDLRQLCDNKSQLPDDFVKTLVTESLGSEIINKVNDLNLVIANHISDKVIDDMIDIFIFIFIFISDKVIDDVIDNLSRTYKGLVGDVGSLKKKRSLTPDVLKVIDKERIIKDWIKGRISLDFMAFSQYLAALRIFAI